MIDNTENYFDDDALESVDRFETMIKNNKLCYFDVHEFENLVDHYLENHKLAKASKASDLAMQQHPSSISLQLKHAQVLIGRGEEIKALTILKKLKGIESTNKNIYILIGNIYNILKKPQNAKKQFDIALSLCYDDKEDLLFRIAVSFEQLGLYELALPYFIEVHKLNNQDPEILFEIAYCYEKLQKDKESIEAYKAYLELDPFSDNAWYNLGILYNRNNQSLNSIEAYDFCIAINEKHSKAYFNKANALALCEKFEEAIKSYIEYLDFDDDHASTYSYIGECFEKLEEYDQAMIYYENAIKEDEKFADPWFGMGLILLYQDKIDECLIYLSEAKD